MQVTFQPVTAAGTVPTFSMMTFNDAASGPFGMSFPSTWIATYGR